MTATGTRPAIRRRITITGVVEGVGFRPFVYRLAHELGVTGFVGNDAGGVFVEAQGSAEVLAQFEKRLRADAPPMAVVTGVRSAEMPSMAENRFTIVASEAGPGARTLVSPDVATCDNCLRELFDPDDRRYRHPFITCTDCGPRFTIIRDLPYDRPATTMAGFPMCPACSAEYHDPTDRRFHAQPIACHDCGPRLWFEDDAGRIDGSDAALAAAQRALADGRIVAVKGIGGYHLACRADDTAAIDTLRQRKARDQKPFAVLARDLAVADAVAEIDDQEAYVLSGSARPIVLLRRRRCGRVAEAVAPGNPLLGVMLPYTPVHHLLLAPVPGSGAADPGLLVMTSANVSDEPLCFDDYDATTRLPSLADAVLGHDRPIHVPCDDSVVRVLDGRELPIRRSRGYAPLPVTLPAPLPTTVAVGAELKNTCCLVDGANAFCSAHVGDMGNLSTARAFDRAVTQLTTLHQARPAAVAADAHPAYLSREWAERHAGGPDEPALHLVQHHHAHVVSLLAEHGRLGSPVIGVAFDGTGYGADATVWGGEFLLVGTDVTVFTRVGHLRPVSLVGGDAAVRNPCRMALVYLDAAGLPWQADLPAVAACTRAERAAVRSQLDAGHGAVPSSSMGRLFDAVAALLGVRERIGYEAQAAIELEILAAQADAGDAPRTAPLRMPVDDGGVLDHRPLIEGLVAGIRAGTPAAVLARAFHEAVAQAVADAAESAARSHDVSTVGLTGGVFQNVLLVRTCRERLERRGLDVLTHRIVPPNDAGLALGQAVIAALLAERAA